MTERKRLSLTKIEKEKIFNDVQKEVQKNAIDMTSKQLQVFTGELVRRAALASYLGKSFGGDRDLYETLGYKLEPKFLDYYSRFKRQDIAKRIIEAPVTACWKNAPTITQGLDKKTAFEKAWSKFVKQKKVFRYLARADKLARIGQYGVLFLGLDDISNERELINPVQQAKDLLYMRVYTQNSATVYEIESDSANERYGMPKIYELKTSLITSGGAKKDSSVKVHYTRIIHIAEDVEEDEIFGTPALECILNRLYDLDLIVGGSTEMFWRSAFPGLAFLAESDAEFSDQSKEEMEDQIIKYLHQLERYFKMQGVKIQELSPNVSSPKDQVEVLVDIISGAKGIPKRLLIGSERGELASSQDENNWNTRVDERRIDHCENILVDFIERLMDVGVIEKIEDYDVVWPSLLSQSAEEQAQIADLKMSALQKYMSARASGEEVLPPEIFLRDILNYKEDQIDEITKILESQFSQEDMEAELRATIEEQVRAEYDTKYGDQLGLIPPGENSNE